MAPMKSKGTQFWLCCNIRRRTITNKLMAMFVQVIVVVVVWNIVKRNDRNAECQDTNVNRDMEQSSVICKPGDYTEGTNLLIQDIVLSLPAGSMSTENQTTNRVLKVDIFVRDTVDGTFIMYPKGTPFTLENYSTSEKDTDDMFEFYYDNSVEENDLDLVESKSKNNENLVAELKDSQELPFDGNQMADGKGDNALRFNLASNQSSSLQSDITGERTANQLVPNNQRTNQIVLANNQNTAQIDQQSGSVQFQKQPVQEAQEFVPKQQNIGIVQQNMDIQYDHNIPEEKSNFMAESMTIGQTNTNEAPPSGAPSEAVYAEGFRERIKTFKSEFYGQKLESHSFESEVQYLLNNPNRCEGLETIDLLFLIHSLPESNEQRQRIRTTFVQRELYEPFTVVYVFLVGKTKSPNFQANLDSEAEMYCDIVQGDVFDKVETRTNKGLMGMRWTLAFCPNAKMILKIDQDVFVDTEKLLKGLIPTVKQIVGKRAMLCSFSLDAPIPRSGPNAVSPDFFPNSSKLRPYCKGFAVLMTPATVSSLIAASKHIPLCQLDDMFLYGILPYIAGGIEVYDLGNKRAFHDFGMAVVTCYQELQDKCQYVITKAFSSRFTTLWEMVKARSKSGRQSQFMGQSLWDIGSWRRQFYNPP